MHLVPEMCGLHFASFNIFIFLGGGRTSKKPFWQYSIERCVLFLLLALTQLSNHDLRVSRQNHLHNRQKHPPETQSASKFHAGSCDHRLSSSSRFLKRADVHNIFHGEPLSCGCDYIRSAPGSHGNQPPELANLHLDFAKFLFRCSNYYPRI